MSIHVYQPLEGPAHIRLIALHPASSKDAPLEITFLASTLDDLEGSYEAISYTWGQPLLTFALHVDDGTQICVTGNLDRALRYLRCNDRDRILWADAACINQNDNAEKAVQIPLMVDIFRGAQRVMAWLDPGGDTAVEQRGMQIVKRLSRPSVMRHTIWAEGCREVSCFINLPWFNRLWIVQEVVFSVEVCMICGDTDIAFPRFIVALFFIQEEASPLESDDRARVDAIAKIGRLWSRHSLFGTQPVRSPQSSLYESNSNSDDILSLVETFASYACTDPRDRIYALFSMAANVQPAGYISDTVGSSDSDSDSDEEPAKTKMVKKSGKKAATPSSLSDSSSSNSPSTPRKEGVVSMNIDYSLNVRETYEAFAFSCWKEKQMHADMWTALFMRQHSSRPDDWPSWVPDWRVLPKKTLPIQGAIFIYAFRVISATRTGICLEVDGHRLLLDRDVGRTIWEEELWDRRSSSSRDGVQPCIVTSNISRQSVGSDHSIESQLFQLCSMANGPETARNPDPSTDERQRPPWMSYTTRFPNLLYRKIRKEVLHLDVDSGLPQDEPHGDLLQRLIECLSLVTTRTTGQDPRHSPTPTTSRLPTHINDLERASKDLPNLFVFHDPCTQVNSVGCGDVAPEVGDCIVPMDHDNILGGTTRVIILRRVCLKERSIADTPTYRFIGSGRIFDPTLVLSALGEEFSSTVTSRRFRVVRNEFNIV